MSAKTQTIERATEILTCFTSSQPTYKLNELAKELNYAESTVYRYVNSLQQAGFLKHDKEKGGYELGLRIIELAGVALSQIDVYLGATDDMDILCERSGLLVNLGVLYEADVLHLAYSAPQGFPRTFTQLGKRAAAHCTALGKVLLAALDIEDVHQLILDNGWRPYTEHSIASFDKLDRALEQVRNDDFAIDNQERRMRNACIAAPIKSHSGEVVAALSLSGTIEILHPNRLAQYRSELMKSADRVSERLGYLGA